MRSLESLGQLKNKRALIRVDLNVPIKEGRVGDDFRIKKIIPTVKYLLEKGAQITLITHLGADGTASLAPVVERFFDISGLPRSEINFFDNVRKFPGEIKNDPSFARELAALGDFFVNDAFSVSHREHASVVGIPKYLPSYAGFQLREEVKNLSTALDNPPRPFLFILGGAKFSTKMPLIKKYLETADWVFVGGALANDFLKAKGLEVGLSLVDIENDAIRIFLQNPKLVLPTDVLASSNQGLLVKQVHEVSPEETIIDIGPESTKNLEALIRRAHLVLWNGPLGKYEVGGSQGTKIALRALAESSTKSILGGGDTVSLASEMGLEDKFSFVSTGGGATLEFLATGSLPGIKALG